MLPTPGLPRLSPAGRTPGDALPVIPCVRFCESFQAGLVPCAGSHLSRVGEVYPGMRKVPWVPPQDTAENISEGINLFPAQPEVLTFDNRGRRAAFQPLLETRKPPLGAAATQTSPTP